MTAKVLTEHYLEFLTGGCKGLSESTHVKMHYCWKSHVTAQIFLSGTRRPRLLIFGISITKWSSTKFVQIIALGPEMAPPRGQMFYIAAKTQSDRDSLFHF